LRSKSKAKGGGREEVFIMVHHPKKGACGERKGEQSNRGDANVSPKQVNGDGREWIPWTGVGK